VITLTTYDEARDAFRRRELRQALYDEGRHLMDGVIVNLHGDEHLARRRLENRLFRRDTFAWYERDVIPSIIDQVLAPAIAAGAGELRSLARRTMMLLAIDVAGIDRPDGDAAVAEYYALMDRLARASTVAHATGDKQQIIDDGDEALAEFETTWYRTSLQRRMRLVDDWRAGRLAEDELPRDVLTTLIRNQDRLDLGDDVVLREIAYFPWVASHSTSNELVHALHHMFEWIDAHPADRAALVDDDELRQRFVHESLRLHPASPVAMRIATQDLELRSGATVATGETVVIDVASANRDPAAVGADPDRFDPHRTMAEGVAPWVLSFGHGTHACLGQELAGGMEPDEALDHHLLGSIAVMAGRMLRAGATPDPQRPAVVDRTTTREMWGAYPVVFDSSLAATSDATRR
jgi:cytochrome P450